MTCGLPDPRLFHEALLAIRDPLARIALASSALEAAEPASERAHHAEALRAALADADVRLDELSRALELRRSDRDPPSPDCRDDFARVCARAVVAAEARGVQLECGAAVQAVPGDAAAIRRTALRALRAAYEWAGAGGKLRIALSRDAERVSIDLSGDRIQRLGRSGRARDLLTRFALAEGVHIDGAESFATDELSVSARLPLRTPQ